MTLEYWRTSSRLCHVHCTDVSLTNYTCDTVSRQYRHYWLHLCKRNPIGKPVNRFDHHGSDHIERNLLQNDIGKVIYTVLYAIALTHNLYQLSCPTSTIRHLVSRKQSNANIKVGINMDKIIAGLLIYQRA